MREKRFISQKTEEIRKIKEKLMDDFHDKLKKELAKKEKIISSQLKNEFELNLKKKIEEHEEELKRKKLNLELAVQKKMKEALR